MAKIRKKVQAIADQLQKVEKKAAASPAAVEVRSVSPLPKDQPGGSKPSGKDKAKEKKGVTDVKKEPIKEPVEPKEKRLAGYAGLARRVAGRIVGEIRGAKFWFDDD